MRNEEQPAKCSEWLALLLVVAGGAAIFALNPGGRAFGVGDVLRHAQMVLEMRHHQTWVPILEGNPYYEAAPLSAWLPYVSTRVFGGLSNGAVLLPSALAAWLTLLATWGLARRLSAREAVLSAALFALCYLTWIYARQSRIDTLAGLSHTAAVAAAFLADRNRGGRRFLFWIAAGLFLGVGVAAKGLFAPGILAATLGPFLLWGRRWRSMLEGGGIVLATAAAVTAAWFVPYASVLGPEGTRVFLTDFVGLETMAKFTGSFGKVHGFFWYFLRGIPILMPLSALAIVGIGRVLRRPRSAPPLLRLCTCWVLGPTLLLSLAGGKHMRYLIPIVPALAILSGVVLNGWTRAAGPRLRAALRWFAPPIGFLFVAGGVAGVTVSSTTLGSTGYAVGIGAAAAGGGILTMFHRERPGRAMAGLFLGLAAAITYHWAVLLPSPQGEKAADYLPVARAVSAGVPPGTRLVIPADETTGHRGLSATELSLYTDPLWVEVFPRSRIPTEAAVLSRTRLPEREVRRTVDWEKDEGRRDRWLLMSPVIAPARDPGDK